MRSRLQRLYRRSILQKVLKILFYSFSILFLTAFFLTLLFLTFFNTNQIYSLQSKVDTLEGQLNQQSQKCNIKDSLTNLRKSIVRIIGGEAEGSGFAVDSNTILTNFHVIQFEASPKVVLPDNTFQTAQIILADKNDDLAFLKIGANVPIIPFGDSDKLIQTDNLYAMGFPFGGELPGEMTVKKGILSGKRYDKATGIMYIQTDATLNPGLSGGPMTDECGAVIGINTLGGSGMGMAISSGSIKQKWDDIKTSGKDPLKDITVLDIQPNIDPKHTVEAYYDYIKLRRLDKAFDLLGDYKKDFKFENWVKGYKPNLDTSVLTITPDDTDSNKVNIKLSTKDLVDGEIVYKYFEGYWTVKKSNNKFLLQEAHIKEVKNPDYSWFY